MLKGMIHKLFYEKMWAIGYRKLEGNTDLPIDRTLTHYKVRMPSVRYWYADPFIVEDNGRLFIFCEAMDLLCGKGKIGVAEINGGEMSSFHVVKELSCHTSYPCVFKYRNDFYMVPETCERSTIELYRSVSFPNQWVLDTILKQDIDAVDSTIVVDQDQICLLTYLRENGCDGLSLVCLNMESRQLEPTEGGHIIEDSENTLRPAGSLFKINEQWIRPSQDGRRMYGEKVLFNRVENLTEAQYQETPYGILSIDRISTDEAIRFTKVHTFNRSGGYEVIDLYFEKFMLRRPVMAAIRKIYSVRCWNHAGE